MGEIGRPEGRLGRSISQINMDREFGLGEDGCGIFLGVIRGRALADDWQWRCIGRTDP